MGRVFLKIIVLAAALLPTGVRAQQAPAIGALAAYTACVRSMASRIEPSDALPDEVARAAIFACAKEEAIAMNEAVRSGGDPNRLRSDALYFGSSQAVIARLCRKTGDCRVAPPPAYRPES
jgi:hypothetical protein